MILISPRLIAGTQYISLRHHRDKTPNSDALISSKYTTNWVRGRDQGAKGLLTAQRLCLFSWGSLPHCMHPSSPTPATASSVDPFFSCKSECSETIPHPSPTSRERVLPADGSAPAKWLQSCPTLCDPMDCSPPGSSIHGILQASVLEWGAMPSSRGVSLTQGCNLCLLRCRWILYHWASKEALLMVTSI